MRDDKHLKADNMNLLFLENTHELQDDKRLTAASGPIICKGIPLTRLRHFDACSRQYFD